MELSICHIFLQRSDADGDYVIKAIEQIDHGKVQPKVDFVNGGIGSKEATLSVTAPKGTELDSVFHFYGEKVGISAGKKYSLNTSNNQLIFNFP